MRKEASGANGKEMAPKTAKPAILSAEAAAMEQKLAELRKAMEKERAKREALMANTAGGSIWRNGGTTSGLRTNIKGKGPGDGSPPGGASGSSSGRRHGSVEAAAGRGTSAAAPSGGPAPRASSARSASGASRAGVDAAVEGEAPSVSGSRMAVAAAARGATAGSAEPKAAASRHSIGGSSGGGGGGMSCGTDDGPALANGAFSEADSHRSFLEALNEWRRANRGETPSVDAGPGEKAMTSSAGGGGGSQQQQQQRRPRSPTTTSLEVQTDARPTSSRPSSAKPLSYFDKLVINASSRVAGHIAAGGDPSSARSSLCGQSAMLPRPASASGPPSRPLSAAGRPLSAAGGAAAALKPASAASTTTIAPGSKAGTATATATASGGGPAPDPLSILDRLEELERQRHAAAAAFGPGEEDDDDGGGSSRIHISTATGVVLTKGARLPDEVLLPPNEGC